MLKSIFFQIYKKIIRSSFGSGLGKYSLIRSINNSIISCIKPDFAVIRGHKMVIDSLDNLYLDIFGVHDEFETKIVENILKKGNVVIDIGASNGYYSLLFAKLVGKSGKVFAFEPDPKSFFRMQKNIELNNYMNIVLTQKAVFDRTGDTKLYFGNLSGAHALYDSKDSPLAPKRRKNIPIKCIKLDDFFKDLDVKIDFIKIDAEGAEYAIIHGMESLLRKNKELILMLEFYPLVIKNSGIEPIEYLKILRKNGFELYETDGNINSIVKVDSFQQIIQKYTYENKTMTNLLCVRTKFPKELSSYLSIS